MSQAATSLPPAAPADPFDQPARPSRAWAGWLEPLALVGLFAAAVAIRLPYLWDIPRFTDELQEVSWSLSIARGEQLPLTAVDSYYGPVWSYLIAALFVVFGPSPALPRLLALLLGCLLVLLTYLLTRDLAGRWPAALAAGLLATAGGHVVINSHTARSNGMTPLLTTLAIWLLYRALEPDQRGGRPPRPALLVAVGFTLGLALQTHLSVVALLPGLLLYALWRGLPLIRTRWPYLAALAAVGGYANMLIYNLLNNFWSFKHARSLQEGYTGGRTTDLDYYLTNLAALTQSLSRLLSGTIDGPNSPARFVYLGLALVGLTLLTRRRGPLLALAAGSIVLVLPYFNPRYGPILSGRYLIPLLPIGFAGIGVLVVWAARRLAGGPRRHAAALVAGLLLVAYPLLPLYRYYQDAVADGRTNRSLYALTEAVVAARQPTELVILDEGLAQEPLGAGGTDLKAYRMLLGTRGVPFEVAKVGDAELFVSDAQPTVLFLMEAKKRASLARGLRAAPVSPELESASGSEHRYAVYRLTSR